MVMPDDKRDLIRDCSVRDMVELSLMSCIIIRPLMSDRESTVVLVLTLNIESGW